MTVLVLGGAGFVGLNVAVAFAAAACPVRVYDVKAPPNGFPDPPPGAPITAITADVRDEDALASAMVGVKTLVHGATVTADAARDATDPETIVAINIGAVAPVLRAARAAGVGRTVLLSSAAAYGQTGFGDGPLREDDTCTPAGLYGISKRAGEQIALRLAALWSMDVRIARLSGVFGPWEHPSGLRDTPSPQFQVMRAFDRGVPALFDRPGYRDWTYAPDAAEAVVRLARAPSLCHALYNLSSGAHWSVLAFAQSVAKMRDGVARLAEPGESPTIDHYGPRDRAPMDVTRMRADVGATPRTDPDALGADYAAWWARHGTNMTGA